MTENKNEKIVLIVEDELPLQKAIKIKLEKHGLKSVSVRKIEEASKYLDDGKKVDAIWLDHYLIGKETGLDFVIKLKGNENWRKIPIFVVSNTASAGKVKNYIKLGVSKYYTKSDHRLEEIIGDLKKSVGIEN